MKEASDLAGMFIDRGPVSVLKYKNGDTYTVRDPNRGTLFNKPIVILINAFSASASEYFASTLQDYNRAILVGSTTHGKASAQVLLPLSDTDDLGFCKLTVEKFYRITGKSHQSVGVIPDIELPSLYDNFDTRERYEDFALQNDSIQTKYKFTPLKPLPIEKLDAESKNRIGANGIFDEIKSINEQLVENYIKKNISYP
ncbi:MAG: peptidase S41, partial [Mangrovimonas sp.]|nr:peptidase S41 [Mangrovimonas sp.]